MKALIISDNEEVLTKVDEVFQKNEIDTIVYHWFLKALDNLVEISPDLILFCKSVSHPLAHSVADSGRRRKAAYKRVKSVLRQGSVKKDLFDRWH